MGPDDGYLSFPTAVVGATPVEDETGMLTAAADVNPDMATSPAATAVHRPVSRHGPRRHGQR